MSRFDHWSWPKPPKRPPPKHGIKVKKAGTTWWGRQWIAALQRMSAGYSNRLARGIGYARAGRVHDVVVTPGLVTAKVTGSRATPYEVRITLRVLSDKVWDEAVAAMAREARFSAALLAGEMPEGVDAAFGGARASLFPSKADDLEAVCSCPDWASPCKHIAATHYVLGEAFDRDPFVLFDLRGRTKQEAIEALRAARVGPTPGPDNPAEPPGARVSRKKRRGSARRESADSAPQRPSSESLNDVPLAAYGKARNPLPPLSFAFTPPRVSAGVLEQLGKPDAWSDPESPAESLRTMIRAAAERARRWALEETVPVSRPGAGSAGDDARPTEPGPHRARRPV